MSDVTIEDTRRDEYFRYDDQAGEVADALLAGGPPSERETWLRQLGDIEFRRAGLHEHLFGEDPYSDEDPTPAKVWMADEARLFWLMAEAEHGRVQGARLPVSSAHEVRADARTTELQDAASHLLNQWVQPGADLGPLFDELISVWLPMVSGQAGEGIVCVADPRGGER